MWCINRLIRVIVNAPKDINTISITSSQWLDCAFYLTSLMDELAFGASLKRVVISLDSFKSHHNSTILLMLPKDK